MHSISNTEWAPGTQPPGYLFQMLLLEVPDALPACQTMLITCYGGFYYAWGWCAGTVYLFANIYAPSTDHPLLQKTPRAAVPSPQAFSEGTLSLEIVMASFFVLCGVSVGWVVCWAEWGWAAPKKGILSIPEGRVQAPPGLLISGLLMVVAGISR